MYLHMTFADGSNPYVEFGLNGTDADLERRLRKWKKLFEIDGHWSANGYWAKAVERNPPRPFYEEA